MSSGPDMSAERAPREIVEQGGIAIGSDVPEAARDGAHLKPPIQVIGWAYCRLGIESVDVHLEGTTVSAQYGLFRHDVADALAEPAAVRSGFSAVLDGESLAAGPKILRIVATDRGGRTTQLTIPVVVDRVADEAESGSRALDNEGERYVPEAYRGTFTEVEHEARYSWVARLAAGREVLDAGCGVGWGTVRLAHGGALRAVGVDIDEPALVSAMQRAAGSADFMRGDLLALPLPDASFDLVVCFEAIEHVSDPPRALDELRRVLRPGGVLAVSSPNRGVYPAGNPHHQHELTSVELEESLRDRFANVAMYHQQTHLAALLADAAAYGSCDPELEIAVHVYKTAGGRPGDELYTIGLASDGQLPGLEGVAVLGAIGLHERVKELEQGTTLAEAKIATARADADAMLERNRALAASLEEERQARRDAEKLLEDLRASMSWRVTAPLRAAKRTVRDSPRGSGSG